MVIRCTACGEPLVTVGFRTGGAHPQLQAWIEADVARVLGSYATQPWRHVGSCPPYITPEAVAARAARRDRRRRPDDVLEHSPQ